MLLDELKEQDTSDYQKLNLENIDKANGLKQPHSMSSKSIN